MKSGRIFWGTLFVVFGGLILIENFYTVNLPWDQIWRFWPVVLILIGLSALTKGKEYRWLFNAGIAFIAGFILFATMQHGCSRVKGVFEANGDTYTHQVSAPFDSAVRVATFRIDGGAGSYIIADSAADLLLVRTRSSFGHYFLEKEYTDSTAKLELAMKEGHIRWQGGKFKNAVKVSLNPGPLWDLDLNLGAAAVDLDLSPYRLRKVNIDAGAAAIKVKLGARSEETHIRFDAGASSITVYVPQEAGCEITSGAELSSSNILGFTKLNGKTFMTPDFAQATKRIYLEIDGGILNIEVRRYAPGVPLPDTDSQSDIEEDTGGSHNTGVEVNF